jgi:hypothetical protein
MAAPDMINRILRLAAFQNPEFYRAQRCALLGVFRALVAWQMHSQDLATSVMPAIKSKPPMIRPALSG